MTHMFQDQLFDQVQKVITIKREVPEWILAHFRMLIHEFLNKDPDIVTEEATLIVLDSNSAMCMAKNGKDTKHTRHIARRINFVHNGEK